MQGRAHPVEPGCRRGRHARSRNRNRRAWLIGAAVGALWLTAAPPAAAHEFSIVVVTSDAPSSLQARRGFQLAVDQSPDVSHPTGREAGDHLGGIDVDIVTVDGASPQARAARLGALLDDGAAAVVTLASGASGDELSDVAASRGVFHVAVADRAGDATEPADVLLRPRPVGQRDEARVATATSAFTTEYGIAPTQAALLGYDAGRLLDGLVSALGESLTADDRLPAAARAAQRQLVVADAEVVAGTAAALDGADAPSPLAGRATSVRALLVAGVGLLLVGAVALVLAWRGRGGRRGRGD